MKYLLVTLYIVAILLIVTTLAFAQPGLPNAPSQAPIDGGLGILAAAGGTYAFKKLRDRKKQSNDED